MSVKECHLTAVASAGATPCVMIGVGAVPELLLSDACASKGPQTDETPAAKPLPALHILAKAGVPPLVGDQLLCIQ